MIRRVLLTSLCFLFIWIPLTLQCEPSNSDVMDEMYKAQLANAKNHEALMARLEQSRKDELKRWCSEHCVTEWSAWSPCNSDCGNGQMTRKRDDSNKAWCKDIPCSKSKKQTQTCKSGCPFGGSPGNHRCQGCPRSRKGHCCQTEIFCNPPRLPAKGRVIGDFPATPYKMVEFTCNAGYNLNGSNTAMCQSNGQWNEKSPKCEVIQCSEPIKNEKVKIRNSQPDGYAFEEKVFYGCEEGHTLEGPVSRTCKEGPDGKGRWTGYDVTCKPIVCPHPSIPQNGQLDTTNLSLSFQFNTNIRFKCNDGYKLIGSDTMQCWSTGQWIGHEPTCEAITCEAPFKPRNGQVRIRKARNKAFAFFECDDGYRLQPPITTLICTEEGTWNETEPKCLAASCGDPGTPDHGHREGNIFTFGNKIKFACERGYMLKAGSKEIECQSNARWSGTLPTCEACPIDFYMNDEMCKKCPPHSHTTTTASTSETQCLCDSEKGFVGPPGGPCEEIFCTELSAPENGEMSNCKNKVGSTCTFNCSDGYVVDRGATKRTCQHTGEWDGTTPFCEPCRMNTFKSGERTCSACPLHSHTNESAQMESGCLCDEGYEGPAGGPCIDINECKTNNGKGNCQDTCKNIEGDFECGCSIPGYIPSPQDPLACVAEKECRNLTKDDAPENGGLVCHWYREENSRHCTMKCNPGFEIPSRSNDYESCGPSTNYNWTYQVNDPKAEIPPCIPEFFPEFRMEGDAAYFAAACSNLTEEQKAEAKQQFADTLNKNGICKKRETQLCDVKDMGIICGRTTRRRKRRGVEYTEESVDFAFNVTALQFDVKITDCPTKICPMLRIPPRYCKKYCKPTYKRYLRASVEYAKTQLKDLYSDPTKLREMILRVQDLEFDPKMGGFQGSSVIQECPEGMAAINDQCVPCAAGSFLDKDLNDCVKCPPNTYQDKEKQLSCIPCTTFGPGFFTRRNGSTECQVCPEGTYGLNCKSKCDCAHGSCSPFGGQCVCTAGWEGKRCETDVNSCNQNPCYPGVTCIDQPAPSTGYTCGPCPSGYHGDGTTCTPLLRQKRSIGHMSFEL